MQTHELELTTSEGAMRAYEALPDGDAAAAVIVIQEAFGLNAHIEDVTRRIADAGFRGLAIDLFHRAGGGTADYSDFGRVIELFAGLETDADILSDVDAALAHLASEGIEASRVGIVGFCFGGRVAFLVAANRDIGASVSFYGGGIASKGMLGAFPALLDEASTLTVPWLGLFGDLDGSIPIDDVEALRAAAAGASVPTEVVRYPDAEHGFHCDVRDSYHPEAARDAWARTVSWFGAHLATGR